MLLTNPILWALLAWSPVHVLARSKKNDAILLSKVKSLTLRDGHDTSHRRVDAIPQLGCVGGSAQGLYTVDVMRCENAGAEYDAEDVQWTCRASLPPEFKLGSTDVICEGYDSADDPYVLKGSCGVEYRLILTDFGEERYREHAEAWRAKSEKSPSKNAGSGGDTIAAVLFWLIFAAIVIAILYSIFFSNHRDDHRAGRPLTQGYNGGGGGGGDDDPPPPYTPRSYPKVKKEPRAAPSTRASSSRTSNNQQQQGWRPGVWTGAAAGAAGGYAAANYFNRSNRSEGNRPEYGQPRAAPPPPSQPSSSNWGGFGGSSSNSAAAPSSSRQDSTGFGGTKRR